MLIQSYKELSQNLNQPSRLNKLDHTNNLTNKDKMLVDKVEGKCLNKTREVRKWKGQDRDNLDQELFRLEVILNQLNHNKGNQDHQ
jgi:hypothetical protein